MNRDILIPAISRAKFCAYCSAMCLGAPGTLHRRGTDATTASGEEWLVDERTPAYASD